MFFSIVLLIVIVFLAFKASPVEKEEHAHVHGAGQIGLLAALALFGVDYFTSYFYATGELMSALHPYGLQKYAWIAVIVISIANAVFGILYMYSLGVFNEGGGSYTASMRYLSPGLSLVVAVVLLQDYIFTIVVSSLSGVDQMLSLGRCLPYSMVYPRGTGHHTGSHHLVFDHSRTRRISARSIYHARRFRFDDHRFGNWTLSCKGKRRCSGGCHRSHQTCLALAGGLSHVDCFHERSCGAFRSRSHVERHSIRDQ